MDLEGLPPPAGAARRQEGEQVDPRARMGGVEAASQLAHPDVEALIAATIDQARIPLPSKGKGSLSIKSDGAEKPPRRRPSK
jgi:hypothetical protein